MCTISSQKCVCFVFLVVLAVLSCSGFRIDNLTMTDVSKRNSSIASTGGYMEALFVNSTQHRLRHRRHMQETTRSVRRRSPCPEVDPSWKAYMADSIAVASVQSHRCIRNCIVQFKIHEWLKNPPPYNDQLVRLIFRTDRNNSCENDDPKTNRPIFLVKNNNEQSKRYILFLRTTGPHNFTAAFAPELNRTRTFRIVKKVNDDKFKVKPLHLEISARNESQKRLRLLCRARGFPIPIITWKVNNTPIHPNNHRIRITQKNDGKYRRKSTLVIRNLQEEEWGRYECVARSVDGKSSHASKAIIKRKPASDSDRIPCDDTMKSNFCHNGGTCFKLKSMAEYSCECPNGFVGLKCEEKSSERFRY